MPGPLLHRVVLLQARSVVARVLVGALLVGALLVVPGAGPAAAAERTVTVTAEGVQPQVLTAAPGDTVRFVVEDDTFAYRAQSTGGDWRFDSGPVELLSGEYEVPSPLRSAGTYTYRVAQDPPFHGTVVVTADGSAAGSSPPASPGDGGSSPVPPADAGAPTAAGQDGPVEEDPAEDDPTEDDPAEDDPAGADPSPGAAAPPGTSPPALAQRADARRLGLPAALALLLVVGTASLLLRTLLAEPVLSGPGARLRPDGGRRPRW